MNYEIVEIEQFSGSEAKVYSIIPEGNSEFVRKFGNYVYALFDEENSNLRLYCIRFSTVAIILGGGGFIENSRIKLSESESLSNEVEKIMAYAACILKQLDKAELYWSNDGSELLGNLKNYNNEDDE